MRVRSFPPSAALAPFVSSLVVVETDAASPSAPIPEAALVVGFRYGGAAAHVVEGVARPLPDVSITGIPGALRRLHTTAGGGIVVARLRPMGAAALFAPPLHELFDATAPLDAIVPRGELAQLSDALGAAATAAERVGLVDRYLCTRRRDIAPDRLVARAVDAIHAARGNLRIGALARGLAISQDPLEKRFRRAIGASPKHFASLVRFRAAVAAYRPDRTLTSLAYEAGYFDQSHFTRDFRAFTGVPPERFFRAAAHCHAP